MAKKKKRTAPVKIVVAAPPPPKSSNTVVNDEDLICAVLAFHHMFDPDDPKEPVLRGERYRNDPQATWETMMPSM